ncbi:MAG: hypothetical protein LW832_07090, partial [Parachlamydia sp.]|nr:hypothetical protein [Parachlamydia sp.]
VLNSICRNELQSELVSHLQKDPSFLQQASPEQIAEALDILIEKKGDLTDEQLKEVLKVVRQNSTAPDLKAAKQNASNKQVATQLKAAFGAVQTIAEGILYCVEAERLNKQITKQTSLAQAKFELSMEHLGLDTKINEFYFQSLPSIKKILEKQIIQSSKDNTNRWIEAAKLYQKAVSETNETLKECLAVGSHLDQTDKLKALSSQLRRMQVQADTYHKAQSRALQRMNFVNTLVQVAGMVAAPFNPVMGAAFGGMSGIGNLNINYAMGQNTASWQKMNSALERRRQEIASVGRGLQEARQSMQNHVAMLLERQRQESEILLTPGIFQPLRQQQHLRAAIQKAQATSKASGDELNIASSLLQSKKAELARLQARAAEIKANTPHSRGGTPTILVKFENAGSKELTLDEYIDLGDLGRAFVKEVIGEIFDPATHTYSQVSVKGRKNLEAFAQRLNELAKNNGSLPSLVTEIANLQIKNDRLKDTKGAADLHLKELKIGLKYYLENDQLPLYMQEGSHRLIFEKRLESSDAHIQALAPMHEHPDFHAEWCEAKRANLQLHLLSDQKTLSDASVEDLPKMLPAIAQNSINTQFELLSIIQCEQGPRQKLITEEETQRLIFDNLKIEADQKAREVGESHPDVKILREQEAIEQARISELGEANPDAKALLDSAATIKEQADRLAAEFASKDPEVQSLREQAAREQEILAGITDKRFLIDERLIGHQKGLTQAKQLALFSVEFIMRLPPKTRFNCCRSIIESLEQMSELDPLQKKQCSEQILYFCELERSSDSDRWLQAKEGEIPALFNELFQNSRERQNRLQKQIEGLQANDSIELANWKQQLAIEERSRHVKMIGYAKMESSKLLKTLSLNRAGELEASLVGGHQQFLEALKHESLPHQLTNLSGAIEGLLQQWSPEWYKDKAIYGRMSTLFLSSLSAVTYLGGGVYDLSNRTDTLKKEWVESTLWGLLTKVPSLMIGGYAVPAIGAVTGALQLWQLYQVCQKGGTLPPTLEQQIHEIHKSMQQYTNAINKGMNEGFTAVLETLESQEGLLQHLESDIQYCQRSLEGQLEILQSMQLDNVLIEDKRRLNDKKASVRDQMNALTDSHSKLQQLLYYAQDCHSETFNGMDRKRLFSLETASQTPSLFIGLFGDYLEKTSKTQAKRVFPASALLLQAGEHFKKWGEQSKIKKLNGLPKEIHTSLSVQCDSLLWIFEQYEMQVQRTSEAFKQLQKPFATRYQAIKQSRLKPDESNIPFQSGAALKALFQRFGNTYRIIKLLHKPLPNIEEKLHTFCTTEYDQKIIKDRKEDAAVSLGGALSCAGAFIPAVAACCSSCISCWLLFFYTWSSGDYQYIFYF